MGEQEGHPLICSLLDSSCCQLQPLLSTSLTGALSAAVRLTGGELTHLLA